MEPSITTTNSTTKPLQLIVLRGLPGSGKSTVARKIVEQNPDAKLFSTDDFFHNQTTGTYDFNTKSLPKAHAWNQYRTEQAMTECRTPIVIDNTNLSAQEAHAYVKLAKQYGYEVEIREPSTEWKKDVDECHKRNVGD
jgi:predicted kinase